MTASLTPLSEDSLSLNLSQIEKYSQDLVSQNVTGAFVNGSSGQSVSLSLSERKEILEAWVNSSPVKSGRLKILPHVGGNCFKDTLELAKHAADLGVFGIGVMPPSFFKPRNEKEVAQMLIHVAQNHPTLPIYYYHIPSMTGVNVNVCET